MRLPLSLAALLLFCSAGFAATARNINEVDNTVKFFDLCSDSKDICRNVRVILPPRYKEENAGYPTLYLLADDEGAKPWRAEETLLALREKKIAPPMLIIEVEKPTTPSTITVTSARYAEFMVRELAPYIGSNFRALNSSSDRIIVAAGKTVEPAFIALTNYGTFSRAAFFSPMVSARFISDLKFNDPILKLWLDASPADGAEPDNNFLTEPVAAVVAVNAKLARSPLYRGYHYLTGLKTAALSDPNEKAARLANALLYLCEAPNHKIKKMTAAVSSAKAGLNRVPENVLFSLKTVYENGLLADEFPEEKNVRVSPPYFGCQSGLLTLRHGAVPGPVKITGLAGKFRASATVTVVKTATNTVQANFAVVAPPNTPKSAVIHISTANGNHTALAKDRKNPRVFRYRGRFAAGTALRFSFSLGTDETAEKDAQGAPLTRTLVLTADTTRAFRPAMWISPEQIKAKNLAKQIELNVVSPAKSRDTIAGPVQYRFVPGKGQLLKSIDFSSATIISSGPAKASAAQPAK